MATLRELLTSAGFNWDTGIVVWQRTSARCPGWSGAEECVTPEFVKNDHWILDQEFDDGYGGPEMPRFVAKDHSKIYFPCQYDGSTWVDWVCQSLTPYVEGKEPMPYPGG